jgi:hypothetical protein
MFALVDNRPEILKQIVEGGGVGVRVISRIAYSNKLRIRSNSFRIKLLSALMLFCLVGSRKKL